MLTVARYALYALCTISALSNATTLSLNLSIPRQDVAEYHRPYLAILLHLPDGQFQPLAVWYDKKNREEGGVKWLRDLRAWTHSKTTELPLDAITSATRRPDTYTLPFTVDHLANGRYELLIEAAREVGGYEVLKLPFQWNGTDTKVTGSGRTELGDATLTVRP